MKNGTVRVYVAVFFAIAFCFQAHSVLAFNSSSGEDGKYYPGSACQTIYGEDAKFGYHSIGVFTNMSTNKMVWVTCPIVRDASKIKRAGVWVIDHHPTENIACKLRVLHSHRLTPTKTIKDLKKYPTLSEEASTNNKDPDPQELTFRGGPFIPLSNSGFNQNHAFLECSVPQLWNGDRSMIINYYVVETN